MAVACSTPRVRDATLVWPRFVFGSKKRAILRSLTSLHATREQYGRQLSAVGSLPARCRAGEHRYVGTTNGVSVMILAVRAIPMTWRSGRGRCPATAMATPYGALRNRWVAEHRMWVDLLCVQSVALDHVGFHCFECSEATGRYWIIQHDIPALH